MSNRTDWEALSEEILSTYEDEELWSTGEAKQGLRDRLKKELHNAFIAGQEAQPTPLVPKNVKSAVPENVGLLYVAAKNQNARLLANLDHFQSLLEQHVTDSDKDQTLMAQFEGLFGRDLVCF